MLPSAADIQYFTEIAHTQNISRAAERLGISQPSLSLALRRLEANLGTALFIRLKSGVKLTPAGAQLLSHSKALLQCWEKAQSQALASQNAVQGSYTLGCSASVGIYLVSNFLPSLLAKYPKLEIKLKHDISRKITEEVVNLSVDIGLVVNPFQHPDLIIRKLFNDEFAIWQAKKSFNQDVIICDPELTQTQFLLKQLKSSGITPKRMIKSSSLEVITSLTANGCGIGIMPERIAKYMHPNKLKKISKSPSYADEICIVYRNENRSIQSIRSIIDAITQVKL